VGLVWVWCGFGVGLVCGCGVVVVCGFGVRSVLDGKRMQAVFEPPPCAQLHQSKRNPSPPLNTRTRTIISPLTNTPSLPKPQHNPPIHPLTLGSTPAEYTSAPSALAATHMTSATCCCRRLISVPNRPSQNWVAPSLSPDTMVPSGSTARDQMQGGTADWTAAVMRSSSWPWVRCDGFGGLGGAG